MKYTCILFTWLCALTGAIAQGTLSTDYLEDQFYAGITYNLLLDKPTDVSQTNFSNGIQLGYIRDIPLHPGGNKGLGVGLGYAVDSYYTNLRASRVGSVVTYETIASGISYKRNKLEIHSVEMPVEFRWRTSTAESYKFWRIYTGIKLSYAFANASKYIESQQKDKFFNPDVRRFQYGCYLSVGYNTWNFYANYQITPLFKDSVTTTSGDAVSMHALKIGLLFYIL